MFTVAGMLNVKSSKTQTEVDTATNSLAAGIPRKFYFTPSMGYVPLSSSASGSEACALVCESKSIHEYKDKNVENNYKTSVAM